MRIYGDTASGNCLKVRYVADLLGLAYAWVPVDVTKGETRTAGFLAEGSDLVPADAYSRAKMDELLFWEQNLHEPFVAGCIFQIVYLGKSAAERDPDRVARAEKALDLMERLLAGRTWFVGDAMTLADIALVAYTRRAPMGGFDLAGRPAVTEWIARCERTLGLAPLRVAV